MYRLALGCLAWLLMFVTCCSACVGPRKETQLDVGLSFAEDIKFNEDQVMVCAYISKEKHLRCVTYEEFLIRLRAAKDEKSGNQED